MKELREKLEQILLDYQLVKSEDEVVTVQEEVDDENEIGVATDGTRYYKRAVYQYLQENGGRMTQDYVDMVAKKFEVGSVDAPQKVIRSCEKLVHHTELEHIPEEQLPLYIQINLLKQISCLRKDLEMMMSQRKKEYTVDIVYDNWRGSTDLKALNKSLYYHAKSGWELKQIITNEVGKNSSSFAIGATAVGVNSTMDQIILVFECPIQNESAK